MEQIKQDYYPKDKKFTEISMRFFGSRLKPEDFICYSKLMSLNKKLGLTYPEFVVENEFFSYGNYFRYGCRSILEDNTVKSSKIRAICSELIKYGIKTNSIPIIEFINFGEQTTTYTLADYLKSKEIRLQDLNIEEITEVEK